MATPELPGAETDNASGVAAPYLVLARKYRPLDFSGLIGQNAMVQTLGNAFETGRIHHAFILTGVRGVGKTTTARILARAFNYVGPNGPQPTLDLATPGEHCEAIIEGRHVDVVEMDAASHTGIDDVREIIDSVRYGPVSAPYKVFIIDEVHMLSKQAFNGLLKTLEEPPPYVKFIFATTEIRKVPVTILSRCQRFDLRRVPPDVLSDYLTGLMERESIAIEPEALAMIVRAGEGSVRDCLSLLDQAIAHGGGRVEAQTVRAMLGLADKSRVIDTFSALMTGEAKEALDIARGLYDAGADPQTIIADLAELTHLVTRIKVVPETADDHALTPDERARGPEIAGGLGMRVLTRAWQMLHAGIGEVATAGNAMQAAEMVLIRIAHAADMPTPDEIIEKLGDRPLPDADAPAPPPGGGGVPAPTASRSSGFGGTSRRAAQPAPDPEAVAHPETRAEARSQPRSFADLVALAAEHRDLVVKHALETYVRPVAFEPGRLRIGLTDDADVTIVSTISARLKDWTGTHWMVSVDNEAASVRSLAEERTARERSERDRAHADPLVQAVLEQFPQSKVVNVRVREPLPEPAPDSADFDDDDDEDEP